MQLAAGLLIPRNQLFSLKGFVWADLVPTARDWPAWVGFMVTTHFDLVLGPFHSPIFIRYHLNTHAGELPRSASSHFGKH